MTKRLIKGGVAWALADRLLGEWLVERTEVGLSEAMDGLNRAAVLRCVRPASNAEFDELEFISICMNGNAGADGASRLLRARGFRKAGMKGSCLTYDRQPLYRKFDPVTGLPQWRCVNCKQVLTSAVEPQRCPCKHRTFARIQA